MSACRDDSTGPTAATAGRSCRHGERLQAPCCCAGPAGGFRLDRIRPGAGAKASPVGGAWGQGSAVRHRQRRQCRTLRGLHRLSPPAADRRSITPVASGPGVGGRLEAPRWALAWFSADVRRRGLAGHPARGVARLHRRSLGGPDLRRRRVG